ncbi:hypothetical protein LguiB_004484 [Lonicera macranthoides]
MGRSSKRKSKEELILDPQPFESDPKQEEEEEIPDPQPSPAKKTKKAMDEDDVRFAGEPVPAVEARAKWTRRYLHERKNKDKNVASSCGSNRCESDEEEVLQAQCHYTKAIVDGIGFDLYDDAYVKAGEGEQDYIAKIVEMFEATDGQLYFTAQWFYRAEDTMIKKQSQLIDKRRVFFSEIRDDNPLDSIVSKVKITQLSPNVELAAKEKAMSAFDLYYDMRYLLPCAFTTIDTDNLKADSDESSVISSEGNSDGGIVGTTSNVAKSSAICKHQESNMTMLDLYSGCGAMSTGLCLGAALCGVRLVGRWAVDLNPQACKSLEINHPGCKVRNEEAENFLKLLVEWEKLCKQFKLLGSEHFEDVSSKPENSNDEEEGEGPAVSSDEFEVGKLLAVCYGDPNKDKKPGLYFKVRWKGYGPSDDTWEPHDGLSNCEESIKEFVTRGYKSRLLPLPGDVDVICGGPPCQGISGFNRFRNKDAPLKDPKNNQLLVFMSIVSFLKPKYVLMENVVDIVKFSEGCLISYAIGRLVSMNYQARLGIMAAGSYGVSQCRFRVFLWGASVNETLPQFPLPTHEVVGRGVVTNDYKDMVVQHDEKDSYMLEESPLLGDAISDLPEVTNFENRDEMPYGGKPHTDFQKYIRLKRTDLFGCTNAASQKEILYDHIPLKLNEDDYERVCQIPKRKGANFRDLPGVLVGADNKVKWDPSVERVLLHSGKPLVPDYCMSFVGGRSSKPFGRLSMDEMVTTVVTRAEPHNQIILHPNQDRVLTVRENARLQGFPDCYKLSGPIKERYMQVGNAVAFSVSMALGYTLAKATQKAPNNQPLVLPFKFPNCLGQISSLEQNLDESN